MLPEVHTYSTSPDDEAASSGREQEASQGTSNPGSSSAATSIEQPVSDATGTDRDGDDGNDGGDDVNSDGETGRAQGETGAREYPPLVRENKGARFAEGQFDTVVDTFGLCSCEDPVQVLQQAVRVLKPGGQLLLIEHGRSSWDWLNTHLDRTAERHYSSWGCWWNRDILDIVQQVGSQLQLANGVNNHAMP